MEFNSRTITGSIFMIIGLFLLIIGFFVWILVLYFLIIFLIGFFIFTNTKEDEIEKINYKKIKK